MRHVMPKFIGVFAVLLFTSAQAFAAGSGGYRLEVPDAGAFGKGSAFVGEANTPAAVYYNPAGMTQVVGQAVTLGLGLIEPHATYKGNNNPAAPDAVQMKRGDYAIPNFYYVTKLGTEKVALGIGTNTAWGLTTEWAPDSFAKYIATKTEMINHDYYVSVAYKLTDQWSIAGGVNIDQTRVTMDKKGDQSPYGASDSNIRMTGTDTAAGFLAAAMFKLNERHQFGVVYRSAIHHQIKGKVHIDNIAPLLVGFGVFPATSYETSVLVKTVLPQIIVLGYSFKPDNKWTFNADIEWTDWGQMKQMAPAFNDEANPVTHAALQGGYPINKDWHSSFSAALGVEYAVNDRLRLRGGSFAHQSPVSKSTWDPSIPDSDSLGITMGTGYDLTKNMTLDLAWSGMYFKARKVNNGVGDNISTPTSVDGKYTQWTNLVFASATYKF